MDIGQIVLTSGNALLELLAAQENRLRRELEHSRDIQTLFRNIILELGQVTGNAKLPDIQRANLKILEFIRGGETEMPRPLKYGQGSITKRTRINKNGSVYTWYEGKFFDEHGNRTVITGKTKDEVRKQIRTHNPRTLKTEKLKPSKKFGDSFREWYETFRKPNVCEKLNKDYLRCINIIPKVTSNKIVSKVTDVELQKHINTLAEKTQYYTRLLLRAYYKHALVQRHTKVDVSSVLRISKSKPEERQTLSRDVEQKFIELLPNDTYRLYAIAGIYTGCRPSELQYIQESDKQLDTRKLKVKETKSVWAADRRKGKKFFTREVPLFPEIERITFPLPPIGNSNYTRAFCKVSEALGIKITPHDLRHTFTTRCDELGINETASMDWVGHKNIKTHRRYKHKTTKILDEAAEKLLKSTPLSTPLCTENGTKNDLE